MTITYPVKTISDLNNESEVIRKLLISKFKEKWDNAFDICNKHDLFGVASIIRVLIIGSFIASVLCEAFFLILFPLDNSGVVTADRYLIIGGYIVGAFIILTFIPFIISSIIELKRYIEMRKFEKLSEEIEEKAYNYDFRYFKYDNDINNNFADTFTPTRTIGEYKIDNKPFAEFYYLRESYQNINEIKEILSGTDKDKARLEVTYHSDYTNYSKVSLIINNVSVKDYSFYCRTQEEIDKLANFDFTYLDNYGLVLDEENFEKKWLNTKGELVDIA